MHTPHHLLRRATTGLPVVGGLVILAVLAGCGPSSPPGVKLVPVRGKVTYKGQPVKKGMVSFMPLVPANTSGGDIVDGQYSLSTFAKGDGAPVGKYKVAVTAWEKEPQMGTEGVPAIPAKYLDPEKSGLTADVTASSPQIDFDLKE